MKPVNSENKISSGYGHTAKGTILVIDDDHEYRALYMKYLEPAGYIVHEVEDGKQALEFLRNAENKCKVDLIITDFQMPNINGLEAVERINKLCPGIPIIMVTSEPLGHLIPELKEKGAGEVLAKPVGEKTLLETVKMAFSID